MDRWTKIKEDGQTVSETNNKTDRDRPSSLWILAALVSRSLACLSSLRWCSARSPSVFFSTASSSAFQEVTAEAHWSAPTNLSRASDGARVCLSLVTWKCLEMLLSVFRMLLVFCSSWMVSAWAARNSCRLHDPSPTSPRNSTSFCAFRVCGWRELRWLVE